jgi:hypothetical protein
MNNTQFNENENTLVPLSQLTNFNVESLINRASNNLNQVFPAYFDSNSSTINHDYDILKTHEANQSLSSFTTVYDKNPAVETITTSVSFLNNDNDENSPPKKGKRKRGKVVKEFIQNGDSRSKSKYKRTLGISKKVNFCLQILRFINLLFLLLLKLVGRVRSFNGY